MCVAGSDPQPFLSTDQNPFIQIYSLPPPVSVRLAEPAAWRFAVQLDLTNNSIDEDNSDESLVLDGETYRTTMMIKYGLSDRLEAGLIVPYILQRQGVFDNFIEDWHDIFGLSNHKRTAFASNQLDYSYSGGAARQQLTDPVEGIGDIRLTLGYTLFNGGSAGRDVTLQAGLKLPSGSAAKLLGSGSTDLSLQLATVDTGLLADWDTTLFWSVGLLRLGDSDVLDAIRRDNVAIAALGLARPLTEKVSVKLQLDAHSSFYDSGLAALGSNAVQLTVGGQIELPGNSSLDLGLVENLFTDTTPDLVFLLAWRALLARFVEVGWPMLRSRIIGVFLGLLSMGPLPGLVPGAVSSEAIGGLTYSSALIDQAAALGNETAGIGLTKHPMELSLEADRGEESRDWGGLKQDTLYFGFTQLAVIGVLYVSPQSISGWSADKKEEYSFEKWKINIRNVVWDTDQWWINYTLHPYWGGAYYVRAAERGYGAAPSFWYSFMLSTMYEFGAEALFEQPSIQDMIFTPGLGFFVVRYFMSVREGLKYRAMNGEALTGTDKAKLFFTDPLGSVNSRINSALGHQVSFTLSPAVMVTETPAYSDADNGGISEQNGDLFSGIRMYLTW